MHRANVGRFRKPHPHVLLAVGLVLTGCVPSPSSLFRFQAPFPPQKVLESGDYSEFLAENQRSLAKCRGWAECDVTLLNLGFVYAYPQSPYHDPQKARQYLRELYRRYPQSPWTTQGQVLLAFVNEQVSLEEVQRRLRTDLRARDATIRKLQGQLNRSREIDIEIDKRERELLR
jgi:transglutaminase-like putative cysteine protease